MPAFDLSQNRSDILGDRAGAEAGVSKIEITVGEIL
jgi:hypothetical protein